jgi:hypothetical protein
MVDQNLLSRALPCFRRYLKLLVPAAFAVVSTHSPMGQGETGMEQHDEKHVVPTSLIGISVGRRGVYIYFTLDE